MTGFDDILSTVMDVQEGVAEMSFGVSEITNTSNVTSLAVELLRGSLETLSKDRDAAAQLITKACSVLEYAGGPVRGGVASVRGGLANWQIRKLRAYVDANIHRTLTVSELSALVRLGPSHFQRIFKRSFSVSPHAYLLERRIHYAQTLMLTTQEPLSEIALAAGFADQAHFTSRFRQATGATPRVWRRERQESGHAERQPSSPEWRRSRADSPAIHAAAA